MKNDRKMARVRYKRADAIDREYYCLDIWSNADGRWEEEMCTRFVADAEHPGSPRDFIHYALLIRVIQLVNDGYDIDI